MAAFSRYIGIDYSGARWSPPARRRRKLPSPVSRVCASTAPSASPRRRRWRRRQALASPGRDAASHWLVDRLAENVPTIVGIDHGLSFPLRYFEVHRLLPDWPTFLEDFQRHWPTDAEHTYVDFVRDGLAGNGAARTGNTRWRRMTEQRAGSAKSVFHFDLQGSWPSPPMPAYLGCCTCASNSAAACTSGHSMIEWE